jgi:hypothetical protein
MRKSACKAETSPCRAIESKQRKIVQFCKNLRFFACWCYRPKPQSAKIPAVLFACNRSLRSLGFAPQNNTSSNLLDGRAADLLLLYSKKSPTKLVREESLKGNFVNEKRSNRSPCP